MSEEEINYWLEVFSEDRFAFKSKDGRELSFYKTFKSMKQLQNNWNELKKWLEEDLKDGRSEENVWCMGCYDQVICTLDKMQELEGNNE